MTSSAQMPPSGDEQMSTPVDYVIRVPRLVGSVETARQLASDVPDEATSVLVDYRDCVHCPVWWPDALLDALMHRGFSPRSARYERV